MYRYDPRLTEQGKNPFIWETPEPKEDYKEFLMGEVRYKTLANSHPEEAKELFDAAEKDAKRRFKDLKELGE